MCLLHSGFQQPENQSNIHQHLKNAHGLPVWNRGQSNNQAVPLQSAIRGALEIYEIEGNDHTDVLSFMNSSRYHINELIRQKTLEGPQKVQLSLSITLTKGINEEEKHLTFYANAEMQIVYTDALSEEQFFESVQHIVNVVSMYATSGSGWIFEKVEKLEIRFAKFNPIRGSTYIALPTELSALKCLVNIRNFNDPNCFLYCFTAAYHLQWKGCPLTQPGDRYSKKTNPATYARSNPLTHQAVGDFPMPKPIDKMSAFERCNEVKVNVFRYEKKSLYPFRISKHNSDFVVDLLLITDGERYHYVLITDLVNLVRKVQGRQIDARAKICRNCFHVCSKNETLQKHEKLCCHFETCQVLLPEPDSNSLAFKKFQAKTALPLVVYYDLESIIVSVSSVEQNPQTSGTRVLDKHIPSGYCYVAISHGSPNLEFFHLYRGEDCMQVFVKQMETLAKDIYGKKQRHRYLTGAVGQAKELATHCWICETSFSADNEKVLDHCHFSNQFLGWAHSKCNLQRRTQSFVPIIAHNLSGYDLHHVVKSLHHCNPNNKFSIIPQTDENYISFSFKVWIKDIVNKNQNVIPIYEELRFIDSLRFMQSSLDKLVQSLPEDSFDILDNHFEYCDQNDVKLLHGKGFYHYSYMDTFRKFKLKNCRLRSAGSTNSNQEK